MSDIAPGIVAIGQVRRRRRPSRRPAVTETIEFRRPDGSPAAFEATLGFDELARPKEIFLFGAKEGSDMAAVLADCSVALSVALQHGVPPAAMAASVSRVALDPEGSASLPGSVLGAALDLLVLYEQGPPA